jgi:hypothetical protein
MATMARWAGERKGPPFLKLHEGDAGSVRYPSDLLADWEQSRITHPKQ